MLASRRRRETRMVLPLALYVDGVPYSSTDSVIGIWMYNLVSERRHLLALLKKRNACRCGCRGWCSYYIFFKWLHWSLEAMAQGRYPQGRHDGKPWKESNTARAVLGGQPLQFAGALLPSRGTGWNSPTHLGFLVGMEMLLQPPFLTNSP